MKLSALLKWLLLASVVGALAVWLLGSMIFAVALNGQMLIQSLSTAAAFSLICIPCAVTLERGRVRVLMKSGLYTAALSVIGFCIVYWSFSQWRPEVQVILKVLGTSSIWVVFCTIIALLYQERTGQRIARFARILAVVCAAILGLSLLLLIWADAERWVTANVQERYLSAMGVLTVFSFLVALILGRLKQLIHGDEHAEGGEVIRLPFAASCPRCGLRQELHTGGTHCASCGLAIKVMIP